MKRNMYKATIMLFAMGLAITNLWNTNASAYEVIISVEEVSSNKSVQDEENNMNEYENEDPVQGVNVGNSNDDVSISNNVDMLLNSGCLDIEDEDSELPEIPETKYHKYFQFQYPMVMKGVFSTSSFYFNIPEYWDMEYVYAGISYEVSRLVTNDVPATLTFMINQTPLHSSYISYEKGKEHIAYFKIPVELLREGFNVIEISSFVRVYDSAGCTENQSEANWVNINKDSYIYVGYDFIDSGYKISNYPFPFITTENNTGKHTGILVSDMATNGELAAALYLLADISQEIIEENEITLSRYSDLVDKDLSQRILISSTQNLPQEMKRYLQVDIDLEANKTSTYDLSYKTLVRLIEDELGRSLLLIVADEEKNLMEAVHMLMDSERLSQEKVNIAFVDEGTALKASEVSKLSQLVAGSYTIKDIIGGGIKFIGPFHSEEHIYLPFGKDFVLSSAGQVTLKFRYSDNLDFDRSLITVYWGDIPVASKKLTLEGAATDELAFNMPADVVGTKASSIKIAFDLEIKDLFCTMRQDEMPWAYVTEDSVLYLPSNERRVISFDYTPYPFQSKNRFSDSLVIVSDEVSNAELDLLGKAVVLYGTQVFPYGDLKVIRSSEFDETDADYNIITAGTLNNEFVSLINDKLHFRLRSTGEAFESNNRLVLSETFAENIATFQLIESPFDASRAIFVIAVTNGDTLELARDFLKDKSNHNKLVGDCVIIERDFDIRSFTFINPSLDENKLGIEEFVRNNKQPIIFSIMGAAAMIMLLTASIMILLRAKKYSKKED